MNYNKRIIPTKYLMTSHNWSTIRLKQAVSHQICVDLRFSLLYQLNHFIRVNLLRRDKNLFNFIVLLKDRLFQSSTSFYVINATHVFELFPNFIKRLV